MQIAKTPTDWPEILAHLRASPTFDALVFQWSLRFSLGLSS
jgi:hypothetical protein